MRTSAVTAAEEWIDAEIVEDEVAVAEVAEPAVPLADLIGAEAAARKLAEWFDLAFHRPELLARLGAPAHLGVLLSGPGGVGKATLVRSVASDANIRVVPVAAPNLAVLDPNVAVARLREAIHAAEEARGAAAHRRRRAAARGHSAAGGDGGAGGAAGGPAPGAVRRGRDDGPRGVGRPAAARRRPAGP